MSLDTEKICKEENLRVEYNALTTYFNTVVIFRFTVLGFYLAAVALILGGEETKVRALILFIISFFLLFVELRNQLLYKNLAHRGMQIEREEWGYTGERAYDPFFSHMMKEKPAKEKDPHAKKEPSPDYHKVWGREIKVKISHTWALNLLYVSIGLYSLYIFIFGGV
jgi:hypothetical protein